MTRTFFVAVFAVMGLTACEPKFVDVTFTGIPKCDGTRLENEIALKLEGPRSSMFQRVTGDGAAVTSKLVAGKVYKLKAYKCVAEPCESEKNFFHGEDVTAPEASGTVALDLKSGPPCAAPPAPPAPALVEDAGVSDADAGAPSADAGR